MFAGRVVVWIVTAPGVDCLRGPRRDDHGRTAQPHARDRVVHQYRSASRRAQPAWARSSGVADAAREPARRVDVLTNMSGALAGAVAVVLAAWAVHEKAPVRSSVYPCSSSPAPSRPRRYSSRPFRSSARARSRAAQAAASIGSYAFSELDDGNDYVYTRPGTLSGARAFSRRGLRTATAAAMRVIGCTSSVCAFLRYGWVRPRSWVACSGDAPPSTNEIRGIHGPVSALLMNGRGAERHTRPNRMMS